MPISLKRAGSLKVQQSLFPSLAFADFEAITFDGPESFARRAEHFLAHPEEREAIVRRMQASVRELFTYDALVPRIVSFVRGKLGV